MKQLLLKKRSHASGIINLPGSKSVSNRVLLLAALAEGTTKITNLLNSADTQWMEKALASLGIKTNFSDNNTKCIITGNNGCFNTSEEKTLFLGNAGTAMRPLTAVLAASTGSFIMEGEPRMYERPIKPLVDALREAGADITYLKNEGFPPLKISGHKLHGGKIDIDGTVSSQFITAFLIAAPLSGVENTLVIRGDLISKPYIKITLALMQQFGIQVENHNYKEFYIKGGQKYKAPADSVLVEGDASAASYFLAMGAIAGDVTVTGIGKDSVQGDAAFTEVLTTMGADVTLGKDFISCKKNTLHGIDVDLNDIPDAAMTLVPLALYADSPTIIRNIGSWRIKETDRLSAMAHELSKLGIRTDEGKDSLTIYPGTPKKDIVINTYNDHRMAMCFSLVSFLTDIIINDPDCTAKTFPDYFEKFNEAAKE